MGSHPTPTAAYWSFFETFNRKDPVGWAGAMSYPHVRVSAALPPAQGGSHDPRTPSFLYPTPDDYASGVNEAGWGRFEVTGWVRTQGVTPRVVHRSDTKVHLAGGWTRHRADDSEIISNRVLYVLTHTESGWGIQARFGVDGWSRDGDFSAQGEAAVAAAEELGSLLNENDYTGLAARMTYPFTIVEVGDVRRIESPADQIPDASGRELGAVPGSARVANAGRSGVNVAWTLVEQGVEREEILFLILRDGEWKLAAASAMP